MCRALRGSTPIASTNERLSPSVRPGPSALGRRRPPARRTNSFLVDVRFRLDTEGGHVLTEEQPSVMLDPERHMHRKDSSVKRNGTLHITENDSVSSVVKSYMVTWSPVDSPRSGNVPHKTLRNETALRKFLKSLGIHEERVTETVKTLHVAPAGKKTHSMADVWLTDQEASRHGLA